MSEWDQRVGNYRAWERATSGQMAQIRIGDSFQIQIQMICTLCGFLLIHPLKARPPLPLRCKCVCVCSSPSFSSHFVVVFVVSGCVCG